MGWLKSTVRCYLSLNWPTSEAPRNEGCEGTSETSQSIDLRLHHVYLHLS